MTNGLTGGNCLLTSAKSLHNFRQAKYDYTYKRVVSVSFPFLQIICCIVTTYFWQTILYLVCMGAECANNLPWLFFFFFFSLHFKSICDQTTWNYNGPWKRRPHISQKSWSRWHKEKELCGFSVWIKKKMCRYFLNHGRDPSSPLISFYNVSVFRWAMITQLKSFSNFSAERSGTVPRFWLLQCKC